MALADSWHLKSRAHKCADTERSFEEGEVFYTAIFPDPESEAYERRDFCEAAWEQRAAEAEPPFSFWRSVYKAPVQEEQAQVVDKNDVEGLLQKFVEEDEEHTENMRYILAVMLERQKLLVENDKQETPTGLLRIYEHRKTGEIFIVKDPQVALADVDKIQQEIRAFLEPADVSDVSDLSDVSDQSDVSDVSDQSDQSDQSDLSDQSDQSDESDDGK